MRPNTLSRALVTSLVCAMAAHAQTSPTSGALRGTVRVRKGKVLAGATVQVRNRETGLTRTALTDAQGAYLLSFLPVGSYEVSVSAPGMKALQHRDLRVNLAEATTLNFDLDSAEASATVEIVAEAPMVDTTSVTTNANVTEELIQAIPLNGRNFTDLVQLTPGAPPNTQGYRTAIEGARGIMNNLMIDGTSYNSKFNGEQRGGTRIPFAFGLDSIRELQVITNPFDVQYGDASGGIINAITKSGTNEFTGGVFTQLRPGWGVAKLRPVPFDSGGTNTSSALERSYSTQEYGFNVGGPIVKDKLHYFVNVDYVHFSQGSRPVVNPPTSVSARADWDLFWGPTGMGQLVSAANSGLTLLQESTKPWTNEEKHLAAMARLDWAVNENHRATFRLNVQNYDAKNDIYAGTIKTNIAESNNSSINYQTLSWVVELNSVLPGNLLNQALLQVSTERRPETPNSTVSTSLAFPGFTAGNYYIDPRGTDELTTQVVDNVTWLTGDWTFKGGIDWQFIRYRNTFFPDGHGEYSFRNYGDANAWFGLTPLTGSNTITYYQTWSNTNGAVSYGEKLLANYLSAQYGGFFGKRLTLNLGLRYTREMYDANPNPNPRVQGLDQMPDNGSWDPRAGFALDLFGDGRTVIRGGYGYFSTANPAQNVASAFLQNGQNTLPYKVVLNSGTLPYFQAAGLLGRDNRYDATSGHITAMDASLIGPGSTWNQNVPSSIQMTLIDPRARMAHSRNILLGVEHDFGNGYLLKVRGIQKRFTHLQYFMDINLEQKDPASGNWDPSIYYQDGYPFRFNQFATGTTNNRPGRAVVAGRNLDLAGYGAVGLSRFDGTGHYRALIVEFEKVAKGGMGIRANATFSSSRDSNSNERNTAQSVASNPIDPSNPTAEGRGDNDIPFRGVLTATFPRVWGVRSSATFTYAKGYPWTPRYYNDINGDGYFNDPALGGRNSMRQPSSRSLNFKFSREWRLRKDLRLDGAMEVYNPFNWANQTTNLYSVDNPSATAPFGAINVTDKRSREVQFGLRLKF
ncbi:MAG TPA: TonB-dependent receptor [Holophagaceae bacterium]|nr:TonB-dependent receptor [Holophagaceae bacterium]